MDCPRPWEPWRTDVSAGARLTAALLSSALPSPQMLTLSAVQRLLGRNSPMNAQLEELYLEGNRTGSASDMATANMNMRLVWLDAIFKAFMFGYGGNEVMQRRLGYNQWSTFFSAASAFTPMIPAVATALGEYNRARAALTLLLSIEALQAENFKCVVPDVDPPGALVLREVSFSFAPAPAQPQLSNVNAVVPAGSKVALCGRSGCGKSTFMRLLNRLYQPTCGSILVDGVDINQVEVGGVIATVEQDVLLFDLTVYENIRLSKPDATQEEVEWAAKIASLHGDIKRLPLGYDVRVGVRGKNFSGGMRQRVGIARGVLQGAPIMLMDEPVSAQDPETRDVITENITTLCRRSDGRPVTVIASSHSLSFFSKFTFVMFLANKTLAEWGPMDELLEQRGLYFQLVNQQEGISVDKSGRATVDTGKLRGIWLFASATTEALKRLSMLFSTRKLDDGDVLFKHGEPNDTVYLVVSGRIFLRDPRTRKKGRMFEAGMPLCEDALLADVTPDADAVAEGNTMLLTMPRVFFEQVLELVPALSHAVKSMADGRDAARSPRGLRAAWPLSLCDDASLELLRGAPLAERAAACSCPALSLSAPPRA